MKLFRRLRNGVRWLLALLALPLIFLLLTDSERGEPEAEHPPAPRLPYYAYGPASIPFHYADEPQ